MEFIGNGFGLVVFVALLFLALLWILLPFSVFSIDRQLTKFRNESDETKDLLRDVLSELKKQNKKQDAVNKVLLRDVESSLKRDGEG